jgi:cold shock protein
LFWTATHNSAKLISLCAKFSNQEGARNTIDSKYREQQMSNRQSGTVKWFNDAKGFGFIERPEGEDVFVHFRSIRGDGYRTLKQGARVEFNITETDKGYQAEDVAEG